MSGPSSPKATPKRKRDDLISEHSLSRQPASQIFTTFTFEPPSSSQTSTEDGSSSPRTKVANKFRSLSLDRSGGGVTASSPTPDAMNSQQPDHVSEGRENERAPNHPVFGFSGSLGTLRQAHNMPMLLDEDEDSAARKRHKSVKQDEGIALGPNGETKAAAIEPAQTDAGGKLLLETAMNSTMITMARNPSLGGLKKSYPSINRLADSKSRGRKRTGTPPISASRRRISEPVEEEVTVIVDPVRAALTWHEDEITVYDSEDKDDDGTGLNGIGFKPTPAIAYQRAQKRKKQLFEYKKREESEARALRNQKRREALGAGSELQQHQGAMRVRFSDADPETLITS